MQAPLLEEHPVAVPQVQVVEALRQEPVQHVQQQTKSVPKIRMEYRERIIEGGNADFIAGMQELAAEEEDAFVPASGRRSDDLFLSRGGRQRVSSRPGSPVGS